MFFPYPLFSVVTEIVIKDGIKTVSILRNGSLRLDWYEGIGSSIGLLGSIKDFTLTGESYNLACFKHNDTVKYQNNLECNKCFCNVSSGIEEETNNADWVRVFPNPAQSYLTIAIDKPYSAITVEFMDEKGCVVYKKDELESPIALNGFMHGIYFVKLLVDDETVTKKIVIE